MNNSFLDVLEKNQELFSKFNGEIIKLFKFPSDINTMFRYFLINSNNNYENNCEKKGISIYDKERVVLNSDKEGKAYLTIYGNDDQTVLIIRKNDSKIENYRNVVGKKITENEFIETLDLYQNAKLERAGISKRFIKEDIPPINICEEMDIFKLISYYRYLNYEYMKEDVITETFDEPENEGSKRERKYGGTVERKNPIIDYSVRKSALEKYNPKYIIKYIGNKESSEYDAYIYEKDDYTLAVVEPVDGLSYQYNLNLGSVDKEDNELIKEIIKAALEAKEEIVMLDDAIIRKNHTTMESFNDNLEIFLNSAKTTKKFYYDVEKSKDVYRK